MTTLTTFITNLAAITVTGVKSKYAYPPIKLDDGQLPAQWPQMPEIEENPLTFQAFGGWPILRAQLVIVYRPVAQSIQSTNFSDSLSAVDNLDTALRAAVGTFCKGKVTWKARPANITLAGVEYWAAVADVEGYG